MLFKHFNAPLPAIYHIIDCFCQRIRPGSQAPKVHTCFQFRSNGVSEPMCRIFSQGKLGCINMDFNRWPVFIFLLFFSFDVATYSGPHMSSILLWVWGESTILHFFPLLSFEWRSACVIISNSVSGEPLGIPRLDLLVQEAAPVSHSQVYVFDFFHGPRMQTKTLKGVQVGTA